VRLASAGTVNRAFTVLGVVQVILVAGVLAVFFATTGKVRIRGSGMSPTLEPDALLVCRKRVPPGDLRPGQVIVFRPNPNNSWTKQPALVTARILAIPGDTLGQQNEQYVVNGQFKGSVGSVGKLSRVVEVPWLPKTITVPPDSYFVAQDKREGSYDSQVLSWVRRSDIISTDIRYLLKERRFFKKVG
jgi:signal peptidase I